MGAAEEGIQESRALLAKGDAQAALDKLWTCDVADADEGIRKTYREAVLDTVAVLADNASTDPGASLGQLLFDMYDEAITLVETDPRQAVTAIETTRRALLNIAGRKGGTRFNSMTASLEYNLAGAYREQGEIAEAETHYEATATMYAADPDPSVQLCVAMAYRNHAEMLISVPGATR